MNKKYLLTIIWVFKSETFHLQPLIYGLRVEIMVGCFKSRGCSCHFSIDVLAGSSLLRVHNRLFGRMMVGWRRD